MCLVVEYPKKKKFPWSEPKVVKVTKPAIAKEDITCYKFYKKSLVPNILTSPYQGKSYHIGTVLEKVGLGIELDVVSTKRETHFKIEEGYHSFVYGVNAAQYTLSLRFIEVETVVAECIIPKGSAYFEGMFCGDKGYASDSLKIVRIL